MIEKNARLEQLFRYGAIGILAILAVVLLILFDAAPFCEDDSTYLFICHGDIVNLEYIRRIEKPGDILYSMLWHWQHYGNGRLAPHALLEFANLYNPLWAPLNTLMLLLVPYLLLKNAGRKATAFAVLSLLAVYWLTTPSPRSMIIWRAGSVNYLWGGVGILCSCLLWKRMKVLGLPHVIPIMVAGLAIGNCNETLTIGFAFAMLLHLVFKRRECSWLHWMFFLAFVMGIALNVFSPAATQRLGEMGDLATRLSNAIRNDISLCFGSYAPILILSITAFVISVYRSTLSKSLSLERSWPLWAAAASAAVVNYSGNVFDRSMYGANFFLLVYSVNELSQLPWQRCPKTVWLAKCSCFAAIAVTGLIVIVSCRQAVRTSELFNRIGEYCRDNPGQALVVKEKKQPGCVKRWNINGNKYAGGNKKTAKYFDIPEVTCRTESKQKAIDELINALHLETLASGDALSTENAVVIHLPQDTTAIRPLGDAKEGLDIDTIHIGDREYAIIWNKNDAKETDITVRGGNFSTTIHIGGNNALNRG